ncbi:MAG: non-ribosomal peptide synthetase, partial [Ktedonobacterales bacterium]|nr:non-ribosomal peptide synthetase [Ktedonobacterales bacterium]
MGPLESEVTTLEQFHSSFFQERLWFIDQLEPPSSLYNIFDVMQLQGPLDYEALAQSLQAILARHEILRTTFVARDGHPWQVVAPSLTIPFPLEDLSALPDEQRTAEENRLVAEQVAFHFTLQTGPLIRALLIRLSATRHVMVVVTHHIVSDHWSSGIFWRELISLYHGTINRQPAILPELPLQYADFAEWQREMLQGPVLDEQLRFWHGQLADASHILELPTDFPRPAQFSHKGMHTTFSLDRDLGQALHGLAQREGVTLFMLLLAAFQTLLYRYSGQDDFIIGSPIADRTRPELEAVIGPFVNTLMLRAQLEGDPQFRELLQRVRETCLSAYEHQDTPLEKILEDINPERNPSYTPLFQVFFGLQHAAVMKQSVGNIALSPLIQKTTMVKADIGLTITDYPNVIDGDIEFCTDLFTPE